MILGFPSGPLAVGGDLVHEWKTLKDGARILHIISPTDCCRDRLSGYLFWDDRGSLEQAVGVASILHNAVDQEIIRKWRKSGGHLEKFEEFARGVSMR